MPQVVILLLMSPRSGEVSVLSSFPPSWLLFSGTNVQLFITLYFDWRSSSNYREWVLPTVLDRTDPTYQSLSQNHPPSRLYSVRSSQSWCLHVQKSYLIMSSSSYGLQIGAKCSWFVLALMYLFGASPSHVNTLSWLDSHLTLIFSSYPIAPIAYPIAKLLDYVLGADEGGTHYKKAELKSFLQFHRNSEEPLRDDEITILNGVLSLNDKRVDQIMTPIQVCLLVLTMNFAKSRDLQWVLTSLLNLNLGCRYY